MTRLAPKDLIEAAGLALLAFGCWRWDGTGGLSCIVVGGVLVVVCVLAWLREKRR